VIINRLYRKKRPRLSERKLWIRNSQARSKAACENSATYLKIYDERKKGFLIQKSGVKDCVLSAELSTSGVFPNGKYFSVSPHVIVCLGM
jgi:hypothetical protein